VTRTPDIRVLGGTIGALTRCAALVEHQRAATARDIGDPPDRQAADPGGDDLQVPDPPAFHVPAQQSSVQRELRAHDVCQPVRRVQGQRRVGAALERILILHAAHEQSASTSTFRLAGS
jgi:Citrate synthase, C-terminal domain